MEAKEKAALAAQIAATLLAAKLDNDTLVAPAAEVKAEQALRLAFKIVDKACTNYLVR